ncbi:hypothetical protein TWF696_001849 [Orbilia brochopaga]|uniref:Uncharacterized protein n=1 Tax=Orbilia brochopaga TaxID=3140254 RepID=A0AAV9UAG0_9PEZI
MGHQAQEFFTLAKLPKILRRYARQNLDTMLPKFASVAIAALAITAVHAAPASVDEAKEAMVPINWFPECFNYGFRTGECGGLDYKSCQGAAACDRKTRQLFWRQSRGGCNGETVGRVCGGANCKCIAQDKLALTASNPAPMSVNEAKDPMAPITYYPECRTQFSTSDCGGLDNRKCGGLFSCGVRTGNAQWRGTGGCDSNKVKDICKNQGGCWCAPAGPPLA